EAQGLVLPEDDVLDELAGLVLDLDPDLARADAVELRRSDALGFAVQEDPRPGRVGGQLQRGQRVLEPQRLHLVVLPDLPVERALHGLVALLAQLEVVRAQREVRDLRARGGAPGVEALRPDRVEHLGARAPRGRALELAVHPDLDTRGLGDEERAREDPGERYLERL